MAEKKEFKLNVYTPELDASKEDKEIALKVIDYYINEKHS